MIFIDVLSDEPYQSVTVPLASGDQVKLSFRYVDNQKGWFYSISFKGKSVAVNRRLVICANLLRSMRGYISFGLACTSSDGYEPVFQNDFSSGRVQVFLLNPSDVIYAETVISNYA
jgi:hypothetical protein